MSGNASAANKSSVTDQIGKFGGKEAVARIGQDMLVEAFVTAASQNFDLMRILTDNFYYCKDTSKINTFYCYFWLMGLIFVVKNTKDPVFAFNFLSCCIDGVKELKEIWKKYDDGTDLKAKSFIKKHYFLLQPCAYDTLGIHFSFNVSQHHLSKVCRRR